MANDFEASNYDEEVKKNQYHYVRLRFLNVIKTIERTYNEFYFYFEKHKTTYE
jgi:hypothetical protein